MSETIFAQGTLVNSQTNIDTGIISLDGTDTGPYTTPSTSNTVLIQQWIQKTVNSYGKPFWSNSVSYRTLSVANRSYTGGCIAPDGRVIFAPWNTANIGIFNPATGSYITRVYTAGTTGTTIDQFAGCVLSRDGRIVFCPSTATVIGIYNTVTNVWSTIAGPAAGSQKFFSGVLAPDSNVYFYPYNATYIGVFNTITNVYSTLLNPLPYSGYIGGCLHPNGIIYMAPYNGTNIGIFNTVSKTFTTFSSTGLAANTTAFRGAVVLPDGRVAFLPSGNNPSSLGLYDPVLNTYSSITGPAGGALYYVGGCLLPDGRVFCVPANSTSALIFNPIEKTYTTLGGFPGANGYNGSLVLPDGRIILIPQGATTIGIILGQNRPVPPEFCIHPIFNRSTG